MDAYSQNKYKIINDPIYGFVKIKYDIIFQLVEHPLFQRLRRIKQLGMTHFVYPGATHTRFQHALGAMHLINNAIETIRSKGNDISNEEAEAVNIAILLHDIGHGPFSHALEKILLKGIRHEEISLLMMESLNKEFGGRLSLAIEIFKNQYKKHFLHQLVSGQLDVDRLDYLRRDSFFTGVTEGAIGSDRIIKMLQVHEDQLVVEEKGVYSIEKFLVSRRFMYWQVYLHKGVIAADQLLILMLDRVRELSTKGIKVFATPALEYFLDPNTNDFSRLEDSLFLEKFGDLDDTDIISAAKVWAKNEDPILKFLSSGFTTRKLFRTEINDKAFSKERIHKLQKILSEQLNLSLKQSAFLVTTDSISNHAYSKLDDNIKILCKDGIVKDISEVSEILDLSVLSKEIKKFYLCYPKIYEELQ